MTRVYVIDSSSLIHLHRQIPRDVFPSVWRKLESKIKDGMLIAPREVKKETSKKSDLLSEWIAEHPGMFVGESDELRKTAINTGNDWPDMVEDKEEYTADLWVIALARLKNGGTLDEATIVTQEKARGNQHKIPFIAGKYGIESVGVLGMFRREKWTF